jgi:outer membrane immunogenic protein
MKAFLLATVAFASIMAPAMAADLPVTPAPAYRPPIYVPYRWGGFYIGLHGGGDWLSKDWFAPDTPNNLTVGCGVPGCNIWAGGHTSHSWLAGGQFGFNFQWDWLVLGIEVQQSWSNLEGSNPNLLPARLAAGVVDHSRTNWLGTAAPRFGVAWDRVLVYAKGGGAWAFDRFWTTAPVCDVTTCVSVRELRWGWMAGVGVEFGFLGNWSVKVEYDHLDFTRQRSSLEACIACAHFDYDIQQRIDLVKVGLNYSFSSRPIVTRY